MKNTWDYSEAGNKTSVKIHNAPGKSTYFKSLPSIGGNSQFSLGWGNEQPSTYKPAAK